jgi:DNA-binding transcriptional MerR regulator
MDEGLTIAEVAATTGLTAHTLRYYERAGLLEPPQRGGNGHRRYTAGDMDRIRMLTRLRDTGMSIADVRRYFELVRAGESTAAQRRRLLAEHRAGLVARIARLQEDLALIDYKIESYGQIEQRCALAEPAALSSPA